MGGGGMPYLFIFVLNYPSNLCEFVLVKKIIKVNHLSI